MSVPGIAKLRRHLKKYRMTQRDFARLIGVSEGQIGHILSGRRRPSIDSAESIETATFGDVKPQDWYAKIDKPKQEEGKE